MNRSCQPVGSRDRGRNPTSSQNISPIRVILGSFQCALEKRLKRRSLR